jgi:hypothetical protein
MLLLSSEKDSLTTHTLFQAMKESAVYLSLAGLQTDALQPEEEQSLPAGGAVALYDAFEAAAEQLVGAARSLMISLKGGAVVLAADTARVPDTVGLPVSVRTRQEDGILYLELSAGKGGERVRRSVKPCSPPGASRCWACCS